MSAITLNQYLLTRQVTSNSAQRINHLTPDLTQLILQTAIACKGISAALHKGALAGVLGSANSDNVQGETQKKLDIISNVLMVDTLLGGGIAAGLASEEMDEMIVASESGKYLILFDPLDGSSNIDVNMSVGTIFSILERPNTNSVETSDFYQAGQHQVAAGYALYGPSTLLVLTLGNGVDVFTLDRDLGEFILTSERLSIPTDTQEFAINMSNQRHWEKPMQRYVNECLEGKEGVRGKDFNMRWVASMVGDVHRILMRGGIFMYPYDLKDPKKAGKLRLMYEANPMSFLIEQAGGASTTGRQRIMDVDPTGLHQRIPVVLGSRNEVLRVTHYHVQPDADFLE
ncbi:MAG: class 1 fructose-bisphosphatase [Gammaproteobacteria bacterium]|nr:class 1 fructose-bisphosphatase [Gammaproteobacteria bacterium]